MTDYERYLFDLNGYIVVEDVLSAEQVIDLNEALDQNRDRLRIRPPEQSLDGRDDQRGVPSADHLRGQHGRGEFAGFLSWPKPWCQPFRELLSLPAGLRYMIDTVGDEIRLEEAQGLTMTSGSEGFIFHGGGTLLATHFFFRNEASRFRNGLMAIAYQLSDVGTGDGGFACIPGSHKANYPCPLAMRRLEVGRQFVQHVPARAGSAIIFTEALTHGSIPWSGAHERRSVLYRYGPVNMSYSRGMTLEQLGDDGTPLQRALLEPAYFTNRPNIAAMLEEAQ